MKYKLIKSYPGFPHTGITISKYVNDDLGISKYKADNYPEGYDLYVDHPENYPEFWEKVEEKDYKILCQSVDGTIIAVERLSDGIAFALGHRVHNPKCKSQDFVIEKFYLDCNKIHMLAGKGHISINKIEHSIPIFITEDGVKFYKGDSAYIVSKSYTNGRIFNIEYYDEDFKYFSTIEATESYIKENKPMYTVKDMHSFARFCMDKNEKNHIFSTIECLKQWTK